MHLGTKLVIAADAISLKTPLYCSNWFRGIPKFVKSLFYVPRKFTGKNRLKVQYQIS